MEAQIPNVGSSCELCDRTTQPLTEHHLIPRTLHSKKRAQRLFHKHDMKSRKAMLCRPCHSQIHDLITEKDLGFTYNTVEKLKTREDVQLWIDWVKYKPGWR